MNKLIFVLVFAWAITQILLKENQELVRLITSRFVEEDKFYESPN